MDAPRQRTGDRRDLLWELFPATAGRRKVCPLTEPRVLLGQQNQSWIQTTALWDKPSPAPSKCPLQATGKEKKGDLPFPHPSSARREPQRGSGVFLTVFTLEIQVLPHLGNNLVTQEGVKLQH